MGYTMVGSSLACKILDYGGSEWLWQWQTLLLITIWQQLQPSKVL